VRTTKLPRIQNFFDLIKRNIFMAYRLWNIDITGKREPRSMLTKGE